MIQTISTKHKVQLRLNLVINQSNEHIKITFLLSVYKAFNGRAPSYIAELLIRYSTSRSLRSADLGPLAVLRSRLKLRGDRAFAVSTPKL